MPDEIQQRILEYIEKHPGTGAFEMAGELNEDVMTVQKICLHLEQIGELNREAERNEDGTTNQER